MGKPVSDLQARGEVQGSRGGDLVFRLFMSACYFIYLWGLIYFLRDPVAKMLLLVIEGLSTLVGFGAGVNGIVSGDGVTVSLALFYNC